MQHSAGRSNSDYLLADGDNTYSLSLQEGCEVAKVHAEGFVYARAQLFFHTILVAVWMTDTTFPSGLFWQLQTLMVMKTVLLQNGNSWVAFVHVVWVHTECCWRHRVETLLSWYVFPCNSFYWRHKGFLFWFPCTSIAYLRSWHSCSLSAPP